MTTTTRLAHPRRWTARLALLAFMTVLVWSPEGGAYTLRTSKDGKVLVWPRPELKVLINATLVGAVAGAADAVRAAFYSWTSAGVPVRVTLTESKTAAVKGDDGQNVVAWMKAGWPYASDVLAMTVSRYQKSTTRVSETDILLNARDHSWTTSPKAKDTRFDIQNVMTHEVGHLFGLGHSPSQPKSAMYPTTPAGETTKRKLSADDRAGIVALIQAIHALSPTTTTAQTATTPYVETDGVALPLRNAGCSAAGGAAGGTGVALLLLGLLVLVRRRAWLAAVAVPFLFLPATADASVVRALSLEELGRRAEVVVRGVVVSEQCVSVDGFIFTDFQIEVRRQLKGQAASSARIALRLPGGELGDQGMQVEGVPAVRVGQELVVFGEHALRADGQRDTSRLFSLGLGLGIFRVQDTSALRDLTGLGLLRGTEVVKGSLEQLSLEEVERAARAGQGR